MTLQDLIAALSLPASTCVDRRIAKKLLLEQGVPTSTDKRHITEGIEELAWIAALKPTNVGIPAFRDDAREYLEIAVLRMAIRPQAKATRLIELVHRAVPYPVVLFAEQTQDVAEQEAPATVSLAHKRRSQGETGKWVLEEGYPLLASLNANRTKAFSVDNFFLESLALDKQPRANMFALYQGWVDTVHSLHAAKRTGTFALPMSAEYAAVRREALRECASIEAQIAAIRSGAEREKQVPRQAEMNLELQRLRTTLDEAKNRL